MTHFVLKLMIDDLEHRLCIEEIAHNSVLCMSHPPVKSTK